MQFAEENDLGFRSDYSGRGMFGKTCVGVTTDDPNDLIAQLGIRGAVVDQMGKRHIVYWPKLSVKA
jgi:hypothetical protein